MTVGFPQTEDAVNVPAEGENVDGRHFWKPYYGGYGYHRPHYGYHRPHYGYASYGGYGGYYRKLAKSINCMKRAVKKKQSNLRFLCV